MAKIVQFARGNKNLYNILTAEEKQRMSMEMMAL